MSFMSVSNRSASSSPVAVDADNQKKTTGHKYTISLSFAGLITSFIILIIAVGWIFAFGVIIGRGYNPEKELPELAKLLPPQPEDAQKKEDPILKPEELTFMADLKQQTRHAGQAVTAPMESAKPAPTPAPSSATEKTNISDEKAKTTSDITRADYVFQAVAYKKRMQADQLREKMEGEGLRTRMTIEKDHQGHPKWYRVQVLLRGTEATAAEAKEIMASMGINDPQLISKKPVK